MLTQTCRPARPQAVQLVQLEHSTAQATVIRSIHTDSNSLKAVPILNISVAEQPSSLSETTRHQLYAAAIQNILGVN